MKSHALSGQVISSLCTIKHNKHQCRLRQIASRRCYSSHAESPIKILGLESSADDTCAAIVDSHRKIYSNVVLKQDDLLAKYGGIHPYHATARHQNNMAKAIRQCLDDAEMEVSDVQAIAYTRGPGMPSCLAACALSAKTLAVAFKKPLIGVHHMQAHALTVGLTADVPPAFPYLTLLISGGHTLLLSASGPFEFQILATTDDDAIGDAFDKVARWLDIPSGNIGGGAALEAFVGSRETQQPVSLPATAPGKLLFSFSGLKAAVKREVTATSSDDLARKHAIAVAFQRAAVGQLEEKVSLVLKQSATQRFTSLVVSGGVASNLYLRESRMRKCLDANGGEAMGLLFPPVSLCTDNAVMIAWAAIERYRRNMWDGCESPIRPKWSISECDSIQ